MSKLLLIDDDEEVLSSLEEAFREAGHAVSTAASAAVAIAQLDAADDADPFEVAVVDMYLESPHAGLDLIRHCRLKSPLTLIVVLTAHADYDNANECRHAGAFSYVEKTSKEYGLEQLFEQVRLAIEERQRLLVLETQVFGLLDDVVNQLAIVRSRLQTIEAQIKTVSDSRWKLLPLSPKPVVHEQ